MIWGLVGFVVILEEGVYPDGVSSRDLVGPTQHLDQSRLALENEAKSSRMSYTFSWDT